RTRGDDAAPTAAAALRADGRRCRSGIALACPRLCHGRGSGADQGCGRGSAAARLLPCARRRESNLALRWSRELVISCVIPAQAGIQMKAPWTPAFAGVTMQ